MWIRILDSVEELPCRDDIHSTWIGERDMIVPVMKINLCKPLFLRTVLITCGAFSVMRN